MVTRRFVVILLLPAIVSGLCFGEVQVGQWEVFELELAAEKEMANPYAEGLAEGEQGYICVEFAGDSDAGHADEETLAFAGFSSPA